LIKCLNKQKTSIFLELPKLTRKTFQDCIETNIAVYNNLAASLLQIQTSNPTAIDKYASIVIELDETNEKAWFRKGQVWFRFQQIYDNRD
jgi:hypothetical protein